MPDAQATTAARSAQERPPTTAREKCAIECGDTDTCQSAEAAPVLSVLSDGRMWEDAHASLCGSSLLHRYDNAGRYEDAKRAEICQNCDCSFFDRK